AKDVKKEFIPPAKPWLSPAMYDKKVVAAGRIKSKPTKIMKAMAMTAQYDSMKVMIKTRTAEEIIKIIIRAISPSLLIKGSNKTTWGIATIIAPPVFAMAISKGVNPSFLSKYRLKKDSNADIPKVETKITKKAIKNIGVSMVLKLLGLTSVLSAAISVFLLGSVSKNIAKTAEIIPR